METTRVRGALLEHLVVGGDEVPADRSAPRPPPHCEIEDGFEVDCDWIVDIALMS